MNSFLEYLPELLELSAFALGSLGLSAVGVYIEHFALTTAQMGQVALGAWAAVVGGVALVFAYLLATDKAATSYANLKQKRTELSE